tara:strand:+ start:713 stop:2836 length:2124 start_codon:yes stop_codon:yes gene_type:complete
MPATNIKINAQDKTKSAFNSVKKSVSGLNASVLSLKSALGGIGLALGARAFVNFTKASLDTADALGKTAARLGLTTTELQTLRFAAEQSGMQTTTLDMAMQRFTRRLSEAANGTGVLKGTFKELGIDIKNTDGSLKSADSLLSEVADSMSKIPSQGERVRLAFSMFDSEGVKMVNMLQNGSKELDKTRKELGSLGGVLGGQFISDAQVANDAINKLSKTTSVIMMNAMAGVAPFIIKASEAISELIAAARKNPIIGQLTAAVVGLSGALVILTIAGGPISLAIAGFAALAIGAVQLYSYLKKEKNAFKDMGLQELQTALLATREKIDKVTIAWGAVRKEQGRGAESKALYQEIQQLEHKAEVAKKYIDVIKATEKTQSKLTSTITAEVQVHKKLNGITKEANALYGKQLQAEFVLASARKSASAKEMKAVQKTLNAKKKAIQEYKNYAISRMDDIATRQKQLDKENAGRRNKDLAESQSAKNALAQMAMTSGEAELERLRTAQATKNDLIQTAFANEADGDAVLKRKLKASDTAYDKSVMDLQIARAGAIATMATDTAKTLNEQGLISFDAMRAIAISEAIINTYVGATKAIAQGGIFGAVLAGIVLAAGFAQVYKIKNMKPPKREFGGPVSKGREFMVGERGPELFTPNQSGNITANNKLSGPTNINFNIQANDAAGFDQLLSARRGMIISMINRAMHERGRRGLI